MKTSGIDAAIPEAAYDVIVVGSGAGGLTAALAASEQGLSVAVLEKGRYYGGTSALSGGQVWVPNNHLMSGNDSSELALDYLMRITGNRASAEKLQAYVEIAPQMLRFLTDCGVQFEPSDWYPDYFSEDKAGIGGRAVVASNVDGRDLGEVFDSLRRPPSLWTLFGRYVRDTPELGVFGSRGRGWKRAFAKTAWRYWSDIGWRLKHRRDRRLTLGNALIAALRLQLIKRKVPLFLYAELTDLVRSPQGSFDALFQHFHEERKINARRAVIIASGGFEHSQQLRALHHSVPTDTSSTLAPEENTGGGIVAAQAVGADIENMDCAWWTPVMHLPSTQVDRPLQAHAVFRMPGSVCINRRGCRFTNEAASYDRFGMGMLEDYKATGANLPSWMIFDSTFRSKHPCGGILPSILMPDRRIPADWWGKFIYKANTPDELAGKIKVDGGKLRDVINGMNSAAQTGVDPQFGRGSSTYDRVLSGDARVAPNPCLAPINAAPFYAVPLHLGDLGTKGGVRADERARALDKDGRVISGLYVIGNSAGAVFADAYPGPGATLGSAMVFAYAAVNDIAGARPQ